MSTIRKFVGRPFRRCGLAAVLLVQWLPIVCTDTAGAADPASSKDEVVKQYAAGCLAKPYKGTNCEQIRKEAIEIIKDDIQTLGSSADRGYLPTILKIFKSKEVELRIAVADAVGMIGPQDSDLDLIAPLANDPVPDVRKAVSQMISRGKGNLLRLLGQRTTSLRAGLTPEVPADPVKLKIPVAPESMYLFYASDVDAGRLSYVTKGMNETGAFFKGKAKKGPYKLEEFQEQYRYQLQDEDQARGQIQEAKIKQLETVKPDPTDMKSFAAYMEKLQSAQASRMATLFYDSYQPDLFGAPTVYVLEERQIGQRSYPTRYVVVYQEQTLKKPGYRLSWMTVPDDALKIAQVASLAEERQALANKKEAEAVRKRQEALDDLTKKKDEAEKQKFKKEQADLEKELGF